MSDLNLTELKDALPDVCDSAVLETVDLSGVSKLIKDGKIKNIITMVGAGISTAAGIPDFRSPGSGIYDNLDEYNLPNPMAVFLIDYFRPTLSHYFVKLLHEKGLLKRHYTQNVDHLDRLTGLPENMVIEAHGTFHTGRCMKCDRVHNFDYLENIVFFGESLPHRFFDCLQQDFPVCDLLIIMGTSLAVAPFSLLVNKVKDNVPRLYINLEADAHCFDSIPWDDERNRRDVLYKGDANAGVTMLADLLGWKEELFELKNATDCILDRTKEKSKSKDEKKN